MSVVLLSLLLALLGAASAYPFQASFAKLEPNVDCHNSPAPLSYHVHVTYMLTNDQQIKEAQAFRETALKHFAPLLGDHPVCQGTDVEPSGRYGTKFIYLLFIYFINLV